MGTAASSPGNSGLLGLLAVVATACGPGTFGAGERAAALVGKGATAVATSSFTDSLPFTTSANHAFSSTEVTFAAGKAGLASIDQTDAASEFGGGTFSSVASNGSGHLELSLPTASGTYTSRILDAGGAVDWTTIVWTPTQPYGKPLPGSAATESGYAGGSASMVTNKLLLHLDEASWNGTANEAVDSSGQANHGRAIAGAAVTTSGRYAGGAGLTGRDQGVEVPSSASLNLSTAFTAEAWIQPTATLNATSMPRRQTLFDHAAWRVYFDHATGKLVAEGDDGSAGWAASRTAGSYSRVTSFAEHGGFLYAAFQTAAFQDGIAFCTPTASGCGTGDWSAPYTLTTYNKVSSLTVFKGKLYAAGGDGAGLGDVLVCTPSGAGGSCASAGDWSVSYNTAAAYEEAQTFAELEGRLYVGLGYTDGADSDLAVCNPTANGAADVCDAGDWSTINMTVGGSIYGSVSSLVAFRGTLYVGFSGSDGEADIAACTPGTNTTCAAGGFTIVHDEGAGTDEAETMGVHLGKIYAGFGTYNGTGTAKILYCDPAAGGNAAICESGEWLPSLSTAGTVRARVTSMASYRGAFYAGVGGNAANEAQVIKCASDPCAANAGWSVVDAPTVGISTVSALGAFRGALYAGWGSATDGNDLLRRLGNAARVTSSTASWSSSAWTHVALVSDGANLTLYRNGVSEGSAALTSPPAQASALRVGAALGTTFNDGGSGGSFEGRIDEVAVYQRALSATEIGDRYRRGARSAKFQVRVCDDAACAGEAFVGPAASGAAYYSEADSSATGTPSLTMTGLAAGRWFQYQATLATEDVAEAAPSVQSVSFSPAHYWASVSSVAPAASTPFSALSGFSASAGATTGTVKYQLSSDGANWKYHDGVTWVAAGAASVASSNTAAEVNAAISSFGAVVGATAVQVRVILSSANGTQVAEVDQVDITGTR